MPLTATGTEVFVYTMTKFLFDSYDDLEDTITQIKSLKLKSYPGENITDCYTVILVDAERLESAGAFKPEHLGYTTRTSLRILMNPDSVFGPFRSPRRLQILSRNFVCVTWISYHKRSSQPTSPLYKRLRENTAILWIKSGGNRLPENKSLNTNLHFQRHTLWPLRSGSTRLWSRLTPRDSTV